MTIFEECVLEAEAPPLQVLEADIFTDYSETTDAATVLANDFIVETPVRIAAEIDDADPVNGFEQFSGDAPDWEFQAACRSTKGAAELFFSEELTDIVAAKRICAECPVIAPCLEGALSRAEPCGVWGGQLFENGRVLHQKRRRGRPPKVPRPEDQLPAVPVPEHLQKLIA